MHARVLQSKPNTVCGFFLVGNLVQTGDPLVVKAGAQVFTVTPPNEGTLYISARGSALDIQAGDMARVSLASPRPPYAAGLINIYRKDTGEAVAEADPEGESSATKGRNDARGKEAATTGTTPQTDPSTVRSKSSRAERYFKRGLLLLKDGKRQAATKYFDKAGKADPGEAMAGRIADALAKDSDPQPQ